MILKDLIHTLALLAGIDDNTPVSINFGGYVMDTSNLKSVNIVCQNGCQSVTLNIDGEAYREDWGKKTVEVKPGSKRDVEKAMYAKAIETSGGNRLDAAKMLQVSQRTLYRKLKEYNIDQKTF